MPTIEISKIANYLVWISSVLEIERSAGSDVWFDCLGEQDKKFYTATSLQGTWNAVNFNRRYAFLDNKNNSLGA